MGFKQSKPLKKPQLTPHTPVVQSSAEDIPESSDARNPLSLPLAATVCHSQSASANSTHTELSQSESDHRFAKVRDSLRDSFARNSQQDHSCVNDDSNTIDSLIQREQSFRNIPTATNTANATTTATDNEEAKMVAAAKKRQPIGIELQKPKKDIEQASKDEDGSTVGPSSAPSVSTIKTSGTTGVGRV